MGGAAVAAAISESTGASRARIGALYRTLGDPGDVAQVPPAPCPPAVYFCVRSVH